MGDARHRADGVLANGDPRHCRRDVATFIGQAVGWYQEGQPAGFIASIIGAVVLLVIYHLIAKNKQ